MQMLFGEKLENVLCQLLQRGEQERMEKKDKLEEEVQDMRLLMEPVE